MQFDLSVDTYLRLSHVIENFEDVIPQEQQQILRCVRLEYKDGHYYALASNRKIAAIYYLGQTQQPDCAVHIYVTPELSAQCEKEKPFNSKLIITAIPELQIITAKTQFGFNIPNAGFFSIDTPLADWRTWFPKEMPKATKGAMVWITWDMHALNCSSPSGRVVFPEFINAMEPIIVRDIMVDTWIGIFMGNLRNSKDQAYSHEPAKFPDWL